MAGYNYENLVSHCQMNYQGVNETFQSCEVATRLFFEVTRISETSKLVLVIHGALVISAISLGHARVPKTFLL